MTRLLILNGPPGSGKSTLARLYTKDHPLSLALDIDDIRRLIGGWQDDPGRAGLLARDIALEAARVHLRSGHDVVVPQLIARTEFLDRLAAVARDVGAALVEIVLLEERDRAWRHLAARTARAADPGAAASGTAGPGERGHREAALLLDRAGGQLEFDRMYTALITALTQRPRAVVVRPHDDGPEDTYRTVLAVLTRPDQTPGGPRPR